MTTIGNYRLIKKLGAGGFSKVMLAQNKETGEKVALKIMKNNTKSESHQIKELLNAEVNIMKDLDHEGIIRLIDYSESENVLNAYGTLIGVSYIALEYAKQGEFFDFIAEGPKFEEKTVRYFFHRIIEALEYMHEKNIAHRDIKPENLLLDEKFNLKIADFGFATKEPTISGRRGTYGYMAPEVLAGMEHDPKKADIFAAAVLLFIMTTKHCPFIRASPEDKYYKSVLNNDFDTFWKKHWNSNGEEKEFSDSFIDLISKMLVARPGDRASIEEIKAHEWFNLPVATSEEIYAEFKLRKRMMLKARGISENNEENCRNTEDSSEKLSESSKNSKDTAPETPTNMDAEMEAFIPETATTEYYCVANGDILVDILTWFCTSHKYSFEKSKDFFRVTFNVGEGAQQAKVEANVLKKKKDIRRAIEFKLLSGSKDVLIGAFTKLRNYLAEQFAELDN